MSAMTAVQYLIWGAGAFHLLIGLAGVLAPRVLRYREAMEGVTPIVREVFFIHNGYMTLVVLLFAVLCFGFTADLAGASALGRLLSAFLSGFWLLRLVIQVVYHNAEVKRERPLMNLLFSGTFLYLGIAFGIAALWAPAR